MAPLMNMPDLIQEFIKSPTIQLWAYYCWLHIVVTQSQMVSKPDKKQNLRKMVEVLSNKKEPFELGNSIFSTLECR